MKKHIEAISRHIKLIEEQAIDVNNLDYLIEQCGLLQEQLIILRYKMYENKGLFVAHDVKKELVESHPAIPMEDPIETEEKNTIGIQQPFDFSLFDAEEEILLSSEPEKTVEEHYSETTIIESNHGITEEIIIKEHAATIEEGDSIIAINKEETTTISYSNEEEIDHPEAVIASDHPLIAKFRTIEKSIRGERAIIPLDNLIGSFTLTEKLQFINALFSGSSESFGTSIKKLNDKTNMAGALLVLVDLAETNSWNFVKSQEIIEEFMLKICRRYANNPTA